MNCVPEISRRIDEVSFKKEKKTTTGTQARRRSAISLKDIPTMLTYVIDSSMTWS